MAFLIKQPNIAASQVGSIDQMSSYKEAEPVPLGYGMHPYASHWISEQFNWIKVPAGQQGNWNYYSIAASYCTGPIRSVGRAIIDGKEIYEINYTFEDGEDFKTFTLNGALAGGHAMKVTIFRGTETQNACVPLVDATGQNHPPMRGECYALWENLVAGINQTAARQCVLELGRETPQIASFGPTLDPRYGVNLIAAIYGFLKERKGGLAAVDGILSINPDHWAAQAAALETTGIGQRTGVMTYAHPVFTSAQDAGSALSEVLAYFDGFLWDDDGELKIGWFNHQAAPPTGLPEITEADLDAKPSGNGFGDWNAGPTSTTIVFKDRDRYYKDAPAKYNAPVNSRNAKAAKPVRRERPFVHAIEQARIMAAEDGSDNETSDSGVTLSVLKARAVDGASPLMPGSLMNWDYAPHQIDLACRVVERRMRFGHASDLIKVIRERGAFPKPYVAAADERVPIAVDEAGYVTTDDVRLWVMPPGFGIEPRKIAVLINRSKVSIDSATISLSADGSAPWSDVLSQTFWPAKCAVATTIDGSAATLRVVTSSVDFARMNAQDALAQVDDTLCVLVGDELMSVGSITAVSAGTYDLGVLRGRKNTTAAGHASADVAWVFLRSELDWVEHLELERIAAAGAYNATVATKHFKVALVNRNGSGPAKPDDPGLSVTIPDPTPSAVGDLTATAGTGRAVTLVWSAKPGASEYKIYRNTSSDPATATALDAEVSSPTYTDLGMAPGNYWYWVAPASAGELIGPKSNAASVTVVDVIPGGIDSTPPADPASATFDSSGSYVADDGTALAYITVALPATFPSLAKVLNVLYRKQGSDGWIVADQKTSGGGKARIDDLAPNAAIEVATQAFSAYAIASAIVAATGSPFTTPAAGAPSSPTGLSISTAAGDLNRIAEKRAGEGGDKFAASMLKWTAPAQKDVDHYEIWRTAGTPSKIGRTAGTETEFPIYSGLYINEATDSVFVKAVNRSGTASAASSMLFPVTSSYNYGTKDMAGQASNGVAITGGAISGVTISATSFNRTSSRRFKKRIRTIKQPLQLLRKLRGVRFDMRHGEKHQIGVIAEEVGKVFPGLVTRDKRGRVHGVATDLLVGLLIEALKEIDRRQRRRN